MKIVGKTQDGKQVISGVFELKDTHGIPLEISLYLLNKSDKLVDWLDFWEDGINAGWKPETILNTIESAVEDVFGLSYKEEFMRRFKYCLVKKHEKV